MKLNIQDRRYLETRAKELWLKTASPFLIKQLTKPKPNSPKKKKAKTHQSSRKKFRGFKKGKKSKRLLYSIYIKSEVWKKRRIEFYKKFGRMCAACDSKKNLNIHHKSYKHTGNEWDNELVVLCKECHEEFHVFNGVRLDMIDDTDEFIIKKRRELFG